MWCKNSLIILKKTISIAKLIFTPIAICFLLFFAWNTREQITLVSGNIQFRWLFCSLLLWSSLHFISPAFTIRMFAAFSSHITYTDAFLIHSRRLPAKYLPGGIWHSVARATDYHSYGFSKTKVGIYLLLENILAAFVTLLIGASIISMLEVINQSWVVLIRVSLLFGVAALLLLPFYINKITPKLQPPPKTKNLYQSFFYLIIYWFIAASAFVCFISAIPELNIGVTLLEAGGIYIFSWGIGFITLFAPQGIGISEFVSAKLLNSGLSAQSFVVLLATFRLISLTGDLLVWLVAISINRR